MSKKPLQSDIKPSTRHLIQLNPFYQSKYKSWAEGQEMPSARKWLLHLMSDNIKLASQLEETQKALVNAVQQNQEIIQEVKALIPAINAVQLLSSPHIYHSTIKLLTAIAKLK